MHGALIVVLMFAPGPLGQPGPLGRPGPLGQAGPQPVKRVIRATGVGQPPPHMDGAQARLMARRAAEVRAVRNLANKLGYGPRATIRGFRYASTTYRPDGSVEVVVEYPIGRAADSHGHRQAGLSRPPPYERQRTLISKTRSAKDTCARHPARSRPVRRPVPARTRPGCRPWP